MVGTAGGWRKQVGWAACDRLQAVAVAAGICRAGELSKFASKLGVFTDQEGSPEAGARILVRAMEHRDAVPQLVERLEAAKPDVEWPAPSLPMSKMTPPPVAKEDALVDPFEEAGEDEEDAPASARGGEEVGRRP